MESTEESPWFAAVNGEEATNGGPAISPGGGRFNPAYVASGGIVLASRCVVSSIASTKAPGHPGLYQLCGRPTSQ